MSWFLLVIAGLLETVWALALGLSHGFTRLVPSIVFVAAMIVSMVTLGFALRQIPIGTGYAVFVGIGAVGTAILGMVIFGESASILRLLSLLLVVAGIIGLKVFH